MSPNIKVERSAVSLSTPVASEISNKNHVYEHYKVNLWGICNTLRLHGNALANLTVVSQADMIKSQSSVAALTVEESLFDTNSISLQRAFQANMKNRKAFENIL